MLDTRNKYAKPKPDSSQAKRKNSRESLEKGEVIIGYNIRSIA